MSMAEQKRAWQNANGKDPDGPGPGGAAPEGKDAGEGDGEGFDVIPGFEPMDPFLMVGFHSDVFPARNSLDQTPGFPQHPHYGFETVTVMGRGNTVTDHADSMGGSGRYGDGDVQWMCAGRGISHSEMIGLRNADTQNVGQVFQLWLNLPAKSKKCEPHTTMMWAEDIPEVRGEGGATVKHIAGPDALRPPPNSWAADAPNNVRIQRITLEPGATYTLERTAATTALNLYPFQFAESAQLRVAAAAAGDAVCSSGTGAIEQTLLSLTDGKVTVKVTDPVTLENTGSSGSVEVLLLEANPIGEPVTQQGPFVAASKDELEEVFLAYQQGKLVDKWPWGSEGPCHGSSKRFYATPASREEKGDEVIDIPSAGPPGYMPSMRIAKPHGVDAHQSRVFK